MIERVFPTISVEEKAQTQGPEVPSVEIDQHHKQGKLTAQP